MLQMQYSKLIMRYNSMQYKRGFTLLEVMIAVAILGILFSIALPSWRNMQHSSALNAAINEWRDSFHYAQSEAMRLKRNIVLCASADGATCSGNFQQGWIVKDGDTILRDVVPSISPGQGLHMTLNSGDDLLEINSSGRMTGFTGATVQAYISKDGNVTVKRGLVISRQGRIRAVRDYDIKEAKNEKS